MTAKPDKTKPNENTRTIKNNNQFELCVTKKPHENFSHEAFCF